MCLFTALSLPHHKSGVGPSHTPPLLCLAGFFAFWIISISSGLMAVCLALPSKGNHTNQSGQERLSSPSQTSHHYFLGMMPFCGLCLKESSVLFASRVPSFAARIGSSITVKTRGNQSKFVPWQCPVCSLLSSVMWTSHYQQIRAIARPHFFAYFPFYGCKTVRGIGVFRTVHYHRSSAAALPLQPSTFIIRSAVHNFFGPLFHDNL